MKRDRKEYLKKKPKTNKTMISASTLRREKERGKNMDAKKQMIITFFQRNSQIKKEKKQ